MMIFATKTHLINCQLHLLVGEHPRSVSTAGITHGSGESCAAGKHLTQCSATGHTRERWPLSAREDMVDGPFTEVLPWPEDTLVGEATVGVSGASR